MQPVPPTETTATSATWLLPFQDSRPPQEILAALEEDIMKVFAPSTRDGRLIYSATAKINGGPYQFELRYEAALPEVNCYSLWIKASWGDLPANSQEYFRKAPEGWIRFWTRNFNPGEPVKPEAGSAERYSKICAEALSAEARLDSVPAIQQIIIVRMKRGATFSTAHKEGGTILKWLDGQFIRSDYGENPDFKKFAEEIEFLTFLPQFYHSDTHRAVHPDKPTEIEAWKLILRKLSDK